MRKRALTTTALFAAFGVASCVSGHDLSPPDLDTQSGGVAGATPTFGGSSGGVVTSGGSMSVMSGGTTSSGGATSSGGNSSGGAASGSGGGGGVSGGNSNRGGAAGNAGTGGSAGRGGGTGSGGTLASGGTSSGGVAGAVANPPPITNGSNGWASRYWDCCKPACGWKDNAHGQPMKSCSKDNQILSDNNAKNACESGGSAYMCWNASPWDVSPTLSYGFAAASGGNYVCGRCYQLQFTGSAHNNSNSASQSLNGKTMIVQVINNGGVAADQFDLLIPGGGVGALDACHAQWNVQDLGQTYGGFLASCNGDKNCTKQKCQTVFGDKPDLMEGCDWFLGWFNGADNPNFVFKQIACPQAITQKSGLGDPG